jgi:hypothetical protein
MPRRLGKPVEAIEPTVRAILDDVVIEDDGARFIRNYADWVMTLRQLPRDECSRVFVQLAVVADQFLEADCGSVAASLAALARIGLPRPRRADHARSA